MKTRQPSRIIGYTDESGRIGKDELFFFASLWCEKTVHERMAEAIHKIRHSRKFWNVMHFSEMSNLRAAVYQDVASTLAGIPGWTMGVLIYEKRYDAYGRPYDFAHYGRRDEVPELKKGGPIINSCVTIYRQWYGIALRIFGNFTSKIAIVHEMIMGRNIFGLR